MVVEPHLARGNRGGINLEIYANAQPLASKILASTAGGQMPLTGPLVPAADIEILRAWFEAGAPEVSDIPLRQSQSQTLAWSS